MTLAAGQRQRLLTSHGALEPTEAGEGPTEAAQLQMPVWWLISPMRLGRIVRTLDRQESRRAHRLRVSFKEDAPAGAGA